MMTTQARQRQHHSTDPRVREGIVSTEQFLERRSPKQAIDQLNRLLPLEPGNPVLHFLVAAAAEQLRNYDLVDQAYGTVLKLSPRFMPAIVNWAAWLVDCGRSSEALDLYEHGLRSDPAQSAIKHNLPQVLVDLRRYKRALDYLPQGKKLAGPDKNALLRSHALNMSGKPDDAITLLSASSSGETQIEALLQKATIELSHNRKLEARSTLDTLISQHPDNGRARLMRVKNFKGSIDLQQELHELEAARSSLQNSSSNFEFACLASALAITHDALGAPAAAYDCYALSAKTLSQPAATTGRESSIDLQQRIITRKLLDQLLPHSSKDNRPVFITGLPRSGTTLLEQLLLNHSQIGSAGELELIPMLKNSIDLNNPESISKCASSYLKSDNFNDVKHDKIIDKSISSWENIGFILLLFPNAKIIDLQRHPLDVCWSAFTEVFSAGSLTYTYDMNSLANVYKMHEASIKHWAEVAPENICRIKYENLALDPERSVCSILTFLKMEWQDGCLELSDAHRPIRTASMTQAREKIYSTSIGRWKQYEEQLEPLIHQLHDCISDY